MAKKMKQTKQTKQLKRRPTLELLEDRTLLSFVPLDQVLMQGIVKGVSPLSVMNFYSGNVTHTLTPTGEIPAGAVQVGVSSETGEQIFAVADKYVAQIAVTGLGGVDAADPNKLLQRAQGELLLAKLTNANDQGLASVSIDKYLGAGRYLVTAGTNFNLDSLKPELAKLPGFQDAVEDWLFPSSVLQQPMTNGKPSGGGSGNGFAGNLAAPLTFTPVPVLGELPAAGTLTFSGSVSQTILPGSTVSFTVLLDAGQTVAAIVTPDSNLQVVLKIMDPKGNVIGSATGSAAGALTALQAISIKKSGSYMVSIAGVGGSHGNFTLQVLVNSQLQNERYLGGDIDSTLATAQPMEGSVSLGNSITRSGMYGNIPLTAGPGDSYVSERGVGVQLISSSGFVVATLNNSDLSAGTVNGMHIGPNGNLYVGVDTSNGGGNGGEIVEMTPQGAVVATIHLPNDTPTNFFYYPFGFSVASDGTVWVAQPNTGNVIHVDASGNLINSYATPSNPEWTAVRSDGQVFISNETGGIIQQLDPGTGNLTTFATDPGGLPFGLSFTPGGDLIVADPNVGVLRFNSTGTLTQVISDFNQPIDAEVDPSGNLLAATGFGTLDKFTAGGTQISSTTLGGTGIGLGVLGTEGPAPKPGQTVDYYSFSLKKGQSATAVLSDLGKISGDIALVDSSGTLLALGKVINGSEETIDSFIAPQAGTYYLRVTGNGVQYSLVLEKDAGFANGSNTSLASAQNLIKATDNGKWSVLGSLTASSLWGVDWQNAPSQLIHAINTQTGNFQSTFSSPATPLTNPFGFNMAFDGTNLWFNDGAFFGGNTIYKLDPTSGAVLGSFASPAPADLTGLAFLNGSLWGVDLNFNIYQIDPSSGNLISQFSLSGDSALTGLAGDPSRGVLWAVSQTHTLYEIDPVAQTIIKSASDGLALNEQDLGFFNNELYVSETLGPGANDIAVFNADTLTETRDLPMNVATFISGLGADGFALVPSNYYHFKAKVNNKLVISDTAPYSDPSQPFQPLNTLSPVLNLYDAQGNVLATSAPGGGINFKVTTAGDYYVGISGANGTAGDYTLTVAEATGALPAFTVTGTNPPANSYNKPLASITVDFSDTILLTSLPTAKVTFNGKAATGFQVDNDHEVTWFLQATPPGLNQPFTFQIAAGTVKDIHGVGLTGFAETIFVNTVPPHLTANSITEGLIGSTGNLSYTVSFNEPLDPTSVSSSSFDLHGIFHTADYGPDSFSFNATNTTLTINYSGLPQDNYTETLFSSGFKDRAGFFLDGEPGAPPSLVPSGNGVEGGDFFVDFTLRHGTEALPVTFSSVAPIGDLIYQGAFTDVVAAPPGATNTYTVSLAPNQTLTLDLTSDGNLQGSVALYDPSNTLIAMATAASQGGEVLLQTAPIASGGIYSIVVGGVSNSEGLFSIQATLNAAATTGTHGTIATAQDIGNSFVSLGGTSSRGAVLGGINQVVAFAGDAYTSERGGPGVVIVANGGGIESQLNSPAFSTGVVQGIIEGSDGNLYVGLDTSPGLGNGGEILKFSPTGTLLATIHLPNDTANGFYYPFGFGIAADGTLWVPQPNSGHIVHVDGSGNLIKSYSTGAGSNPEWAAVRSDGQVFISEETTASVLQLDPGTGNLTTFAADPFGGLPFGLKFTTSGNLLVSDLFNGVLEYDTGANLLQTAFDFGANDSQLDPSSNYLVANPFFNSVDLLDPSGNFVTFTNTPGTPIGLTVAGVDGPAPPAAVLDNFYSFQLNAGQSATIVLNKLGGTGSIDMFALEDGGGNVLATGQTGATNFTEGIANFVAPTAGTYYIDIHGNNINYGLTVTKDAAFDTEHNNSQATAQPLPAAGGALGAVFVPPGVSVGAAFEGLSFADTNCGCIPPDTNHAVGPTQVVETTNTAIRIYDKSGNIQFSGNIADEFGVPAFSDPYIVYDDIANRFVFAILTTNSSGGDGVALAVSKDSNPLDGWLPTQIVDFGSNLLDFPKVGFNADAYVIEGNLFGPSDTPVQIIAVDKQQLFNGNFVDFLYQRHPGFPDHFRAEMPAQMHGATPGMPMYFVEEAGYGNGSAARIVTLTNELSNNPTFVDTDIPVNTYSFPAAADQPGGSGSVATNDTTFSHAEWRMINGKGMLVSAQNVSEPADGFSTSHVRWYEFNTDGTPSLVQQGSINPGPGVSTYYGAPAININGDIGITYMESSANEFVSMYVAGRQATDPLGTMSPGTDVAPGTFTNFEFFRTGDYGGMGVDPTDGVTFWASHEYAGNNPVYNTFIASFTVVHPQDEDWYSFTSHAGDSVQVTLTLPGSSSGGQFVNNLSPVLELYDPNGNLVASGTTSITYAATADGKYAVRVQGASNTSGEYALGVTSTPGGSIFRLPPPVKFGSNGAPFGAASLGNAALQGSSHISPSSMGIAQLASALSGVSTAPAQSVSSAPGAATAPAPNVSSASTTHSTPAMPVNGFALDAYFALVGRSANENATTNLLTSVALAGDIEWELD